MSEPLWLSRHAIEIIHDEQLAEHGGAGGLRDSGLLESALARPQNLFASGEGDLCALAAAYAEAEQFDDAVAEQLRAIDMLRATGDEDIVDDFQSRLDLYRHRKPYRE